MKFQIPQLFGTTPDKVESTQYSDVDTYIWYLRNKDEQGLHIKLKPEGDKWDLKIYEVEWTGRDFMESNNPIYQDEYKNYNEAIDNTKINVKSICRKNDKFSYISEVLENL